MCEVSPVDLDPLLHLVGTPHRSKVSSYGNGEGLERVLDHVDCEYDLLVFSGRDGRGGEWLS